MTGFSRNDLLVCVNSNEVQVYWEQTKEKQSTESEKAKGTWYNGATPRGQRPSPLPEPRKQGPGQRAQWTVRSPNPTTWERYSGSYLRTVVPPILLKDARQVPLLLLADTGNDDPCPIASLIAHDDHWQIRRFQNILQRIHDHLLIKDASISFCFVNSSKEKALGLGRPHLLQRGVGGRTVDSPIRSNIESSTIQGLRNLLIR